MTRERLTVGVVTRHAAAGPEVELPAVTRDRVSPAVHGAERDDAEAGTDWPRPS